MQHIYLDHNSTTHLHKDIENLINTNIPDIPTNASSLHSYGQTAKDILEQSRLDILKSVFPKNYNEYKLTFTSCGTESNNLAINSFADNGVIYSALEHPSVYKKSQTYINSAELNFDENTIVNFDELEAVIKTKNIKFASIIHANSEMGGIIDISKIAQICRKNECIFHTDASQSFGKINCNFDDILPDLITISSHKIYGPIGASALIYKKNLQLKPILFGGGQEFELRSGTENIRAIYGFSLACRIAVNDFPEIYKTKIELRNKVDAFAEKSGYIVIGKNLNRLPNTTMISKPNCNTSIELARLDIKGILASGGSACSYGMYDNSKIPIIFNLPQEYQKCTIRFSIGIDTNSSDIGYLINHL